MRAQMHQTPHNCWFFLQGVDDNFNITEELLDLHSLQREQQQVRCTWQGGTKMGLAMRSYNRWCSSNERRVQKNGISLFGSTYICEQTYNKYEQKQILSKITDSHLCDILRLSTTQLTPDLQVTFQSK